jgi:hypothetical protein
MDVLPHLEFLLGGIPGFRLIQPALDRAALRHWYRTHQPPAPRAVKADLIRSFTATGQHTVFVETGTFRGDMIAAVRANFEQLFSIELHAELGSKAARRFAADPAVKILIGDSGELLKPLVQAIGRPVVYWLDGHYSGFRTARGEADTPICRELDAVLVHGTPDDIVLIDDARLFGTDPAYPLIAHVEARMHAHRPDWVFEVKDDIVRLHSLR